MSSKEHRKHVEYWKKREKAQRKKNIKDDVVYQKQIEEIYQNMLDEIQKEINGFYVRYAKKEGITIAEAKKRASKLDIEEYARKAKKYVAEKDFSDKANEEMRLYNLTMKVNRLELLKAKIGLELVSGFDELEKLLGEKLTEKTLEELERQAGILGKSIRDNAKAAHAIVNASFHNATFSDRIWMYQDMLKADLSKLLQQNIIQGKHPRELATHLRKRFGVSQYNAERLMITESARIQTEAQKQSLERNGFEYYEYIACGKSDVCEICKSLDGKHFKVKDMMIGENAPPMHPFCHCSTAAWEGSEEYDAWLNILDKGSTTSEWEKFKKSKEKEESKPKYKYKDTIINKPMISSAKYRRKFSDITGDSKISRILWENALDMLEHRNGTKYEDLAFIDSKTGNAEINKGFDKENTALPNKSMKKLLENAGLYSVIAIHNHPGSSAPSLPDIMACIDRKYKYGLIVCHDGKIYKYSVDKKKFIIPLAFSALDLLLKDGYTKEVKKQLDDAGIKLEVF